MECPTCEGTGKHRGRECLDCDGEGTMSRHQQNLYYGEGGVLDAEEDQAYLDRQREEEETD